MTVADTNATITKAVIIIIITNGNTCSDNLLVPLAQFSFFAGDSFQERRLTSSNQKQEKYSAFYLSLAFRACTEPIRQLLRLQGLG